MFKNRDKQFSVTNFLEESLDHPNYGASPIYELYMCTFVLAPIAGGTLLRGISSQSTIPATEEELEAARVT